jgi:integrase
MKTPIQANRASWVLQGLFKLAENLGQIPRGSNPCVSLTRAKEAPCKRILSADELRELELALQRLVAEDRLDQSHGNLVRLICFTGLRRGEAMELRFSDVDLDRKVIQFVDHKTDDAGVKLIPVNSHATSLIAQLANRSISGFLFPGIDPAKHFNGFGKVWERIRKEANLLDITPHDLRRTFGSTAAELGHGGLVADKLLGHQVGKIQETYQSLSPTGLLGRASQEAADWIRAAMNGETVQLGVKQA